MKLELTKNCEDCDLCKSRKNVVWGEGSMESPLMFIAEAPGKHEDAQGYPLVPWAKSGEEYTHLLSINGLRRENVFTTNLLKCRPPGDKDPKPEQMQACCRWLEMELAIVNPQIIGAIGKFSTQYFLGKVNMEQVHGIPFKVKELKLSEIYDAFPGPVGNRGRDVIVIPLYHPAAGLRDSNTMIKVQQDFKTFAEIAKGKCESRYLEDTLAGKEDYKELTDADL